MGNEEGIIMARKDFICLTRTHHFMHGTGLSRNEAPEKDDRVLHSFSMRGGI
jgi:hypothetical protein